MAVLHMAEEQEEKGKRREVCNNFMILIVKISASSAIYRLAGGNHLSDR